MGALRARCGCFVTLRGGSPARGAGHKSSAVALTGGPGGRRLGNGLVGSMVGWCRRGPCRVPQPAPTVRVGDAARGSRFRR